MYLHMNLSYPVRRSIAYAMILLNSLSTQDESSVYPRRLASLRAYP